MFLFWLFCSLIWKDGGIGIDVAWHPSFNQRSAEGSKMIQVERTHSFSFFHWHLQMIPLTVFTLSSWTQKPSVFYFCLTVQSKDDQIQVIGNLKNISMASSKLLLAAKSLSVDPGAANAKNLLAVAARCDNTQKASIRSLSSRCLF